MVLLLWKFECGVIMCVLWMLGLVCGGLGCLNWFVVLCCGLLVSGLCWILKYLFVIFFVSDDWVGLDGVGDLGLVFVCW